MNKKEKLDNMLCEKNGVLKTTDVIEAGISKTYFMELLVAGCMGRSFLFITIEISTDYFFA